MQRLGCLSVLLLLAAVGCASGRPFQAEPSKSKHAPVDTVALRTFENGRGTSLAEFQKPVTVVAVWTSSCPPCLTELGYLQALQERYPKGDVAVVAVSFDPSNQNDPAELGRAKAAASKLGLQYPLLWAPDMGFLAALMPPSHEIAFPLLVVMDRQGNRWMEMGLNAKTADEYLSEKVELIEMALKGQLPDNVGTFAKVSR